MKWYKRKLLKAVVYRFVSLGGTFLAALIVTREPVLATGTMIVVEAFHTVIYVVFEFVWRPVKYRWLKKADVFLRYFPSFVWRCKICGNINVASYKSGMDECKKCGARL